MDVFLPRICVNCGDKISNNHFTICNSCLNSLQLASEERLGKEFNRKFLNEKLIEDFHSAFIFHDDTAIQKVIHKLKYQKEYSIGKELGLITANILENKLNTWNADLIMAIPLHKLRKAERGFNQAEIIAKAISNYSKIKFEPKALRRKRFTQTQTKLNLKERKTNIEDAFKVKRKNKILDKNIILVDDVITTGATISECAKVLKANGANDIYALSVAIAD